MFILKHTSSHYKSRPIDLGEHVSEYVGNFFNAMYFVKWVFEIRIGSIKFSKLVNTLKSDVIKKFYQCLKVCLVIHKPVTLCIR